MGKTLFCDFEFLKAFSSSCPQHNDNPLEDDPVEAWRKVYRYIYHANCEVIGSQPFDVLVSIMNKQPLLWKLLKGKRFRYHFVQDVFNQNMPASNATSVLFTALNKANREKLQSLYGIIAVGQDDVLQFESSVKGRSIHLSARNRSQHSWKDIEIPDASKISNSLIIVDNYILKDTKKFDKNIFSILDVMLPQETEIPYHISVFTKIFGSEEDMQLRYEKIVDETKRIRPKLDFMFEIRDADEFFHDRKMVTNNAYFTIGKGFDIFPLDKRDTDLHVSFPFLYDSEEEISYYALLKKLSTIEYRKFGKHIWSDSPMTNRLLEIFQEKE